MRITDRVSLVGSGANGFGSSHPCDCHVWAIDAGPDDLILIDAGAGVDIDPILRNLERLDLLNRQITILVTHAHADHAGGAGPLGDALGAEVAASPEAAAIIESANEEAASVNVGKRAGSYPQDYRLPRGQVHRLLADGEVLAVGNCAVTVIATPGHSIGHLCYLVERDGRRDLFTGDAVLYGGKIILQNTWDCQLEAQISTLEKLSKIDFEGFFPGHFSFSVSDGHRHIDAALAPLARGGIPPQL
jgi:glyoxylase-like metal-dependent hydrolase (beta-lactamase superfamily II)